MTFRCRVLAPCLGCIIETCQLDLRYMAYSFTVPEEKFICCFSYGAKNVLNNFSQSISLLLLNNDLTCLQPVFMEASIGHFLVLHTIFLIFSAITKEIFFQFIVSICVILMTPASGDAEYSGSALSAFSTLVFEWALCVCLIIPERTSERRSHGWAASPCEIFTHWISQPNSIPLSYVTRWGFLAHSCAKG